MTSTCRTAACGRPALPATRTPSPIGESLLDTPDHPVRIRKLQPASAGSRGGVRAARPAGRIGSAVVSRCRVELETALDLAAARAGFASVANTATRPSTPDPTVGLCRSLPQSADPALSTAQSDRRVHAGANSYSYAAAEVILPTTCSAISARCWAITRLSSSWRARSPRGGLPGGPAVEEPAGRETAERFGIWHPKVCGPCGGRRGDRDGVPLRSTSTASSTPSVADTSRTDVALMLALAHTLVVEGLADRPFLERYCFGAERFIAYLLGRGRRTGPLGPVGRTGSAGSGR